MGPSSVVVSSVVSCAWGSGGGAASMSGMSSLSNSSAGSIVLGLSHDSCFSVVVTVLLEVDGTVPHG